MAELRPYEPSWRDRLAMMMMGDGRASPERRRVVEGLLGSTGLGNTGIGAADFTPAGLLFAGNEYQRAKEEGDRMGAALAAIGMVPGAGPVARRGAAAARPRGALGIESALETRLYPIADTPPSFKVEPESGQTFERWLDALYSPAVRGPDNRIRHPSLMYRGVSDAELQAAIENRAFRPASGSALYIENDPTRYAGGGAYGARGSGAIVQFDAGGLPAVQLSSQRVRDLVEDAVPEIPINRVTRMWRWNPESAGHTLLTPDEMAGLLRLSDLGGVE